MPSTYSTSLRIQLMANNEDNTTWGGYTNTNWQLMEAAVSGFVSIALTSTTQSLTTANGSTDQARECVIQFTGTPGGTVTLTIPAVSKVYSMYNNTSDGSSVTVTSGSGTTYSIPNGKRSFIFCDGTNVQEMFNYNSNFGASVSLSGTNTWTGKQTFSAGAVITPASPPATNEIGYLGLPQNAITTAYTTVMTDAGKDIYHTSASPHTVTIDSNANVPYPIGTIMKISAANGSGIVTLAINNDTLRWIPSNTTGSRTITAPGYAAVEKVNTTEWWVTGVNLT